MAINYLAGFVRHHFSSPINTWQTGVVNCISYTGPAGMFLHIDRWKSFKSVPFTEHGHELKCYRRRPTLIHICDELYGKSSYCCNLTFELLGHYIILTCSLELAEASLGRLLDCICCGNNCLNLMQLDNIDPLYSFIERNYTCGTIEWSISHFCRDWQVVLSQMWKQIRFISKRTRR